MSLENTLAVVSQRACTLSFFNLTSGERLFHLEKLAAQPHELAYDSKRKLLYITHTYVHGWFFGHGNYCHEISVFDIEQKKILDTINIAPYAGPHGIRMDMTTDVLFCSFEHGLDGAGGVLGIDPNTRHIAKVAPSGGAHAHWFVLSKNARKAYTTNKDKGFISVLDIENGTLAKKIPFPGSEEGSLSIDGNVAYYPFPYMPASGPRPTEVGFKTINTITDEVEKTVLTKDLVMSVLATPNNKLMVGQTVEKYDEKVEGMVAVSGRLSLYNAETLDVEGEVEVGKLPLTMRVSADGNLGVVAGMASGTVTVVDLQSMKVVRVLEIDVDFSVAGVGRAHGMAFIA